MRIPFLLLPVPSLASISAAPLIFMRYLLLLLPISSLVLYSCCLPYLHEASIRAHPYIFRSSISLLPCLHGAIFLILNTPLMDLYFCFSPEMGSGMIRSPRTSWASIPADSRPKTKTFLGPCPCGSSTLKGLVYHLLPAAPSRGLNWALYSC